MISPSRNYFLETGNIQEKQHQSWSVLKYEENGIKIFISEFQGNKD